MNRIFKKFVLRKGFTLIEILATVSLLLVLSSLFLSFVIDSLKFYRYNMKQNDVEGKMAQVMREFEYSTRAASGFVNVSDNSLSYYRYYDLESVHPIMVRYYVENDQFKVGRTEPVVEDPEDPPLYPSEQEECVLLIEGVADTDNLFRYYDGQNNLLESSFELSDIRMIELEISLKDTTDSIEPIVGSTKVSLRNMKNNL